MEQVFIKNLRVREHKRSKAVEIHVNYTDGTKEVRPFNLDNREHFAEAIIDQEDGYREFLLNRTDRQVKTAGRIMFSTFLASEMCINAHNGNAWGVVWPYALASSTDKLFDKTLSPIIQGISNTKYDLISMRNIKNSMQLLKTHSK